MLKAGGFHSTAEIDAPRAELEQEKKQLLALRLKTASALKHPDANGTTHFLFDPLDLLAKPTGARRATDLGTAAQAGV